MKTLWMAFLVLFAACTGPCQASAPACSETFDLYAGCNALTPETDRLALMHAPGSTILQPAVCIDERTGLLGLKVIHADVQKIEDTGDLIVLTTIDSSRSSDLLAFSTKYIGRQMVMVKEGNVLKASTLNSLLPNGNIGSGVASQNDAAALMEAINGQCGSH